MQYGWGQGRGSGTGTLGQHSKKTAGIRTYPIQRWSMPALDRDFGWQALETSRLVGFSIHASQQAHTYSHTSSTTTTTTTTTTSMCHLRGRSGVYN